MIRTPLNIGTIFGLVLFVYFLVLYYIGFHPFMFGPVLFAPVPVLAVVMTLLRVKNRELGGKITFRRAFYTGVVQSFVSISLFTFLAYIFIITYAHSFVDDYFTLWDVMIEKSGGRLSGVKDMIDFKTLREEMTPWSACQSLFFNGFFYSSIISMIVALIIKNEKPSLPPLDPSRMNGE